MDIDYQVGEVELSQYYQLGLLIQYQLHLMVVTK